MKKRIFSVMFAGIITVGMFFLMCGKSAPAHVAYAYEPSVSDILIQNEYVIPDVSGFFTYYVLVAQNNSETDLSVDVDFTALDGSGNALYKVNDFADAVKKGQQFIIYGQFRNEKIQGAKDYSYDITVKGTDNCSYSSIDLSAEDEGGLIEVSATNYSKYDVEGVGVRTVFFKNGRAVGFDTVNIADSGYVFHGGSTNSQVIGYNTSSYDDYIITYTCACEVAITE